VLLSSRNSLLVVLVIVTALSISLPLPLSLSPFFVSVDKVLCQLSSHASRFALNKVKSMIEEVCWQIDLMNHSTLRILHQCVLVVVAVLNCYSHSHDRVSLSHTIYALLCWVCLGWFGRQLHYCCVACSKSVTLSVNRMRDLGRACSGVESSSNVSNLLCA
jgi:hypothetical protein